MYILFFYAKAILLVLAVIELVVFKGILCIFLLIIIISLYISFIFVNGRIIFSIILVKGCKLISLLSVNVNGIVADLRQSLLEFKSLCVKVLIFL